jgi:hypothetical protein
VILTGNYGQAGAIDQYGPNLGLPTPYSGHLGFWRWGPPPASSTGPVILVGIPEARAGRFCDSVSTVTRHDNGYGLDNEEQGVSVRLCRAGEVDWPRIWPELRRLG